LCNGTAANKLQKHTQFASGPGVVFPAGDYFVTPGNSTKLLHIVSTCAGAKILGRNDGGSNSFYVTYPV